MSKRIILMHGHHDCLFSVGIYKERVQAIKKHKPEDEWSLRLKLLKAVSNNELPQELVKTALALYKAHQNWGKLRHKRERVYGEWIEEVHNWKVARQKHLPFLEELHRGLCVPDCPWDGKTIFPRKIK